MNQEHPSARVIAGLIVLGVLLAGAGALTAAVLLPPAQLHIGELCLVAPSVFYLLIKKYDFKAAFRCNPISWKLTGISLLLGAASTILTDELDRLLNPFIKMPQELQDMIFDLLKFDSWQEGVALFIAAVLMAAVIEEMLFRGLLQRALERRLGVAPGLVLSALAFALIHFNPWWMAQILILGITLGVLAWRSDSIFPSILVHGVNNAIALTALNFEPQFKGWYEAGGHVNSALVVTAAAAVSLGFIAFWRLTAPVAQLEITKKDF